MSSFQNDGLDDEDEATTSQRKYKREIDDNWIDDGADEEEEEDNHHDMIGEISLSLLYMHTLSLRPKKKTRKRS